MKPSHRIHLTILLMAVLLVWPFTACADTAATQELIELNKEAWIAWQCYSDSFVDTPTTIESSSHCLWDIPFGVDVDTFAALVKENAKMDVKVSSTTSSVFLTLEHSEGSLLFGYPILQSCFGVGHVTQSLGLGANTSSSGDKYVYKCATLRLGNHFVDDTLRDMAICFSAVFDGVTAAYGAYTYASYKTTETSDIVLPDIFSPDGKVVVESIESLFNADAEAAGKYLSVRWDNVELILRFNVSPILSLSFCPASDGTMNSAR